MRLDDLLGKPTTVLWIASSLIAVAAVLVANALLYDSFRGFNPGDADIKNDWVVAAALVAGDNPYRDLDDLSWTYAGGRYISPTAAPDAPQPKRTPRTPGALLLAVPLLLVPLDDLVRVVNTLSAMIIVPALALAIWQRRSPLLLALSLAILVSAPALWSFRFGTVSALLGLLVITAVVALQKDIPALAGASIALAVSLKLFPGILLVVALARRSMRTVVWCGSLLALLNVAPLAFGNVAFSEALDAVTGAGARFAWSEANISITRVIADGVGATPALIFLGITVATMCAVVYRRPSRVSVDSLVLMSVATLLAPLSWPHYVLGVFPLALLVAGEVETSSATRVAILVGFLITIPIGLWPWETGIGGSVAGLAILASAAGFERLRTLKSVASPPRRPIPAPV